MLRHLTICSILVTANIYVSGIVLDQPIQAVFNEYGVIGAKCVTVIIAGTGYVRVKFPNSTLATYIYHGNGMDPSAWKNLRRTGLECPFYFLISHDSEQILAFFKNNMDAMKRQGYFTVVIENDISKQEVKLIQESEPLSKVLKLNIILPIKSMDEELPRHKVIRKSYCHNNDQENIGIWQNNSSLKFFGSNFQLDDLSCLHFRATTFPYGLSTTKDDTKTGNDQYGGFEYKIFKEIASKLGFAYTVSPPVQCCLWGQEQSPGNYTGLVGDLQSSRSDVGWANMFVQPFRKQLIDFTAPFKSDYVCFVVKPPSPLSNWKALFLAFDSTTWWLIIFTMVVAVTFCATFAQWCPQKNRYHKGSMIMYIIGTFIDMSQDYTPKFRFLSIRLFLSLFLPSFFILTNCYRSGLISSLSVPQVEPPIDTIKAVRDLNLPVVSVANLYPSIMESDNPDLKSIASRSSIISGPGSWNKFFSLVKAGESVGAGSRTFIDYIIRTNFTSGGRRQLHIVKECVIDKRVAFGLQKHSIFTDKFSSVIQRLQEAGLINKWVEDELEIAQEKARKRASLSSSPTDSTDQGPKAWTMGELDLPFYILLSMLAMCFLCFAGEVSFGKIFFSGLKAV